MDTKSVDICFTFLRTKFILFFFVAGLFCGRNINYLLAIGITHNLRVGKGPQ